MMGMHEFTPAQVSSPAPANAIGMRKEPPCFSEDPCVAECWVGGISMCMVGACCWLFEEARLVSDLISLNVQRYLKINVCLHVCLWSLAGAMGYELVSIICVTG